MLGFGAKDPTFFFVGIAIIEGFYLIARYRSIPDLSTIVVIGVGRIVGIVHHGVLPISLIPAPQFVIPQTTDFFSAFSTLVLPRLSALSPTRSS
ncbi:MAG: hypothetical protein WCF90_03155 [Methanomicrobiales archaeon]